MPLVSDRQDETGRRIIVFVNGASGAGKTTVASYLHEHDGSNWFHPDGQWNTASMDQKVLTHECIRFVTETMKGTVVIDSQLRQEHLDSYRDESLMLTQVLLDCDDRERAARLRARNWPAKDIDAHILWAAFLRTDAAAHDVPIFDTSAAAVKDIAIGIKRVITQWESKAVE